MYAYFLLEMLLADDSDSEVKIEINKNYADSYNSWRQKEELQKRKFVYTLFYAFHPISSLVRFF
jgi:hypothetical protein